MFKSFQQPEYFLLLDEELKPLNDEMPGIVGDHVALTGDVVEMEDWLILKVNARQLKLLSEAQTLKRNLVAIEKGITLCRGIMSE